MGRDFLLEIGVEELPAGSMEEARLELVRALEDRLREERLAFAGITGYAAPRRLAALVRELAERQEDLVQEVRGPSAAVAFDASGAPTKAALGFSRAQGVEVAELVVREGYVYAAKRLPGRPATEVLAEILPELLSGLRFPKNMRWGSYGLRFIRPIRWLVALYGSEVVPFSVAGVTSGRYTYGHRFLRPGPVQVPEAGRYREVLAGAGVVVDQEERRRLVAERVRAAAAAVGGTPDLTERLLDEVTNLVEHPTAVLGAFDRQHLALPEAVLTTVMAEHQRFFPVRGPDGRLLPYFVGVRDGGTKGEEAVRIGYERVLQARLVDATFFYNEDLQQPLAARTERLTGIIFQEQLGTMHDKTLRLQYLAGWLAEALDLGEEERRQAVRAAYLAKADLTTNLVYEFPELAGLMGAHYAERQGEPAAVAQAIREHYLPRASGDRLPESPLGIILSLADRLDTLVGYWSIGVTPTGSQDPFGLRRQAYGLCLILVDKELRLSWREMLLQAYGQYRALGRAKLSLEEVEADLGAFCRQRLANILEERGIRYDVVNAVLAAGWDWPAGAARRARALQDLIGQRAMDALITTYTRARNLAKTADAGPVRPERFRQPAESELFAALEKAREEVAGHLAAEDYRAALISLSRLEKPLANFFDQVLVMAEDPELRANRLALLAAIVACVAQIADLSQIRVP
ncbi:MAG: glycine--tRNA ligase subunit beta [Moorellales bacterium]